MYRVGVDIGGTFTDCVVIDDAGARSVAKSPTTHGELAAGVLGAVGANAEQLGLSLGELLAATDSFVHGTTVATNAVLTRTGSPTGLITTAGHEDTLIIGKVFSKRAGLGEREIVHASRLSKPEPIVAPELIFGVSERIDSEGEVLVSLDEDEANAAIDALLAAGVEAIAVSLLWSFVDDRHERRIRELVEARGAGVLVTLSCELAPVLGEYERTCTAVLNAYVAPKVEGYLDDLRTRLRDAGLEPPLLVMQAGGGLTSVDDAARRPIVTLDSGPAAGILGCQHLSELYDEPNVICTDVGGTSFDVGLVLGGVPPLDPEPVVAQYSLRLPKIGVRSIGSGGGSICWLDDGGLLRVGPQSAGSRPGPACYGHGGAEATVTDADLVLGYLDPDAFLGGRMRLDRDLALAALTRLGRPLGMEPEEVAEGVFRIVNAQMADLIRRSTIEQGRDPRECVLVAYGGAGPTHAAFFGRDIGAKAIMVLADSTAFSAEGMLLCDVSHTAQRSRLMTSPFDASDCARLASDLGALEEQVLAQFDHEGTPRDAVVMARTLGVRYARQAHTLAVPVDLADLVDGAVAEAVIRSRFEKRYERLYGAGSLLADGGLELDVQTVTGTLAVPRPPMEVAPGTDASADAVIGTRRAHFAPAGFVDAPVHAGPRLTVGTTIDGPAIVQRMGDSVVVPIGFRATVDRFLTLDIRPTATEAP